MSEKQDALRLADALPSNAGTLLLYREQAAAELRRAVIAAYEAKQGEQHE